MSDFRRPVAVLGILSILGTGAIHGYLTRVAYGVLPYLGILFGASFLGALVAAFGISRNASRGWMLGGLVAGCTLAGYALSRTVGLPGLPAQSGAWFDPLGVATLICDTAFLLLFYLVRRGPWGPALRSVSESGQSPIP
jgi:hypothetical protein